MSKKHNKNEEAAKDLGNIEPILDDSKQKVMEPEASQEEETNDTPCEEQSDPVAQVEEMHNKYLRLSAEFDNYRKRTQREKMDLIKYASEDVLKGLLPIIDDFERAIKSAAETTDLESMRLGLQLIHSKFSEFLRSNGVQEIQALTLELDTDVHEAISKIPVEGKAQKGKIVDVVEKGYKLNEKVIRFSKVVVGE